MKQSIKDDSDVVSERIVPIVLLLAGNEADTKRGQCRENRIFACGRRATLSYRKSEKY